MLHLNLKAVWVGPFLHWSMHFSLSYLCYIVELGSLPSVEFYVPFSSARFLCDLQCALVLWSLARSPIGCKQLWQKLISILEFCFIPIIFFFINQLHCRELLLRCQINNSRNGAFSIKALPCLLKPFKLQWSISMLYFKVTDVFSSLYTPFCSPEAAMINSKE